MKITTVVVGVLTMNTSDQWLTDDLFHSDDELDLPDEEDEFEHADSFLHPPIVQVDFNYYPLTQIEVSRVGK